MVNNIINIINAVVEFVIHLLQYRKKEIERGILTQFKYESDYLLKKN